MQRIGAVFHGNCQLHKLFHYSKEFKKEPLGEALTGKRLLFVQRVSRRLISRRAINERSRRVSLIIMPLRTPGSSYPGAGKVKIS